MGKMIKKMGIKLVIIESENMERNTMMVGFDSISQFKYKQGKCPHPYDIGKNFVQIPASKAAQTNGGFKN